MSIKFFSGATPEEAAASNQSTSNLNDLVRQYLAIPANIEELESLLNNDELDPLDWQIAIITTAKAAFPAFAPYSAHKLEKALAYRTRKMSQAISIEHEFTQFPTRKGGKLVIEQILIEDKNDQDQKEDELQSQVA